MSEETSALFQHLVAMLATSALQHLGVLPGAEDQEPDPQAASLTIDMLDMLVAKTHGNLSPDEAKMLGEATSSLKMAFVQTRHRGRDEAAAEAAPSPDDAGATESGGEAPGEERPGLEIPDRDREEKQPRFHKKYD